MEGAEPVLVMLVVAAIGVVLLVGGFLLDGVFEAFEIGDGGWFSVPVLGSVLTMFGLTGAAVTSSTDSLALGSGAGALAGVAIGGVTGVLLRGISRTGTDATPTSGDLVGLTGTVVTGVPVGSYGEVTLRVGGAPMKVSARSDAAVPAGTQVRVVAVLSSTSVQVVPVDAGDRQ